MSRKNSSQGAIAPAIALTWAIACSLPLLPSVQRKAKLQIAVPVDSSPWLPTAGLHFFAPYFTWRVPRLLTDALESGLSTFIALRKKFTTPLRQIADSVTTHIKPTALVGVCPNPER